MSSPLLPNRPNSVYGCCLGDEVFDTPEEWDLIEWSETMLRTLAISDCAESLVMRDCKVGKQQAIIASPASIILQ